MVIATMAIDWCNRGLSAQYLTRRGLGLAPLHALAVGALGELMMSAGAQPVGDHEG
jgi:hypothetical protein